MFISKIPSWLPADEVLRRGRVQYEGETYEYLAVSPRCGIQDGIGNLFTVYLPKHAVLLVSHDCHTEYWDYWITHELVHHHHPAGKRTCTQAVDEEITLVNDAGMDLAKYLSLRRQFFMNLIQYYRHRERRTAKEDELLEQAVDALAHISDILSLHQPGIER